MTGNEQQAVVDKDQPKQQQQHVVAEAPLGMMKQQIVDNSKQTSFPFPFSSPFPSPPDSAGAAVPAAVPMSFPLAIKSEFKLIHLDDHLPVPPDVLAARIHAMADASHRFPLSPLEVRLGVLLSSTGSACSICHVSFSPDELFAFGANEASRILPSPSTILDPNVIVDALLCATCLQKQQQRTLTKMKASSGAFELVSAPERAELNGSRWGPPNGRAPSLPVLASLGFFACRPSSHALKDDRIVTKGVESFHLNNPLLIVKKMISLWKTDVCGTVDLHLKCRNAGPQDASFQITRVPTDEYLTCFVSLASNNASFYSRMIPMFCSGEQEETDSLVLDARRLLESKKPNKTHAVIEVIVDEGGRRQHHKFSLLQLLALSFPMLFHSVNDLEMFKVLKEKVFFFFFLIPFFSKAWSCLWWLLVQC